MMKWNYSGRRTSEKAEREIENAAVARKAAQEAIVLLKNEGVLPLKKDTKIALFGNGASKTVKGGIGSGDVNNRVSVSILQGMSEAGFQITSEDWIADYDNRYEAAREDWKNKIYVDTEKFDNPFDAYANNPFSLPDGRMIGDTDLTDADVAVYVISRISGEGKDRRLEEGDYYLSQKERADLSYLNKKNLPIILLLNAGGPIELTEVVEKLSNVKAILQLSQLGQEGGHAVSDILLGKVNPSGKLTATWARDYEDYPGALAFGYLNGNLQVEEYKEGIFVGYRYFDKNYQEPLFAFGHGLSYTDFSLEAREIAVAGAVVKVVVSVKNIGTQYAGKEVVQIYLTLPQTGQEKERKRLVAFAKTGELKPGEEEQIGLTFTRREMASYQASSKEWVVEEGNYGIWMGTTSKCLFFVKNLVIKEEIHFSVKYEGNHEVEDITKDIPVEDLIPLLYGNITEGTSHLGSAGIRVPGSAGETTEELEEKYGIRSLIMADGPAGLRLRQRYQVDRETGGVYGVGVFGSLENGILEPMKEHENADTYYQYCTAFPVGTAMAQTWNPELLEEFGCAVAKEMKEFHVDLWLAPGMNIHRNPLCGRNFEYFSEDPFLSGIMAAAITKGVQNNPGCGVTIKHFTGNNQEDNRMGVDAHISEKALREIYLKGFEYAVRIAQPAAIMTSYNLINGTHAANSRKLCTQIAREEWGFEGIIMTDWNTTVPEDGSIPWKCVAAGNDIIMPGNYEDAENIKEAYKNGLLSEKEIRACANRVIRYTSSLE